MQPIDPGAPPIDGANGGSSPVWYRDSVEAPPSPEVLLRSAIDAGAQFEEVEVPVLQEYQPPPEMVTHGFEYAASWMNHSYEVAKAKFPDKKLFEDLYHNDRTLDDFKLDSNDSLYTTLSAASRVKNLLDQTKTWRSKGVIPVAPVVDSYVERLHQMCFSQQDYFKVVARPKSQAPSVEDPAHSTAEKLQRLAIDTSDDMQFASVVEQVLRDGLIYGLGVVKTGWYDEAEWVNVFVKNPQDGTLIPKPSKEDPTQQEVRRKVYRQGVQCKRVRLNNFMPDPFAESPDIGLWSGIADKTTVPYHDILEAFKTPDNPTGRYNVGLDEFLERWPNPESADIIDPTQSDETELGRERDQSTTDSSPIRVLKVWEWHGKVRYPTYPEPIESVISIVTGLSSSDPKSGICVRCQLHPVLEIRRRPYLVFPFGPMPWVSIIEQNLDLIWNLSHAENLFLDACRICSIPLVAADETSSIFDENEDANLSDVIFPGKIFKVRGQNSLQAFSLSAGDLSSILNYIQMKRQEWQERTAVSQITRGVEGQKKTASEANILFQQSQESLGTKMSRIRDTVMRPYGQILLCFFKQEIVDDQELWIEGATGVPEPCKLTVEEITSGEYAIDPVFDLPQEAKVSRANNIVQTYQSLRDLEPTLMLMYGKKVRWDNLVEAPFKLLGIMDSVNVIDEATQEDMQRWMAINAPAPPPGSEQPQQGNGQEKAPGADGQGNPNPEGGPMGPEPSDANQAAFEAQMTGAQAGPVPIGGQGPA